MPKLEDDSREGMARLKAKQLVDKCFSNCPIVVPMKEFWVINRLHDDLVEVVVNVMLGRDGTEPNKSEVKASW